MTFIAELSMPTSSAGRYIDALCTELAALEIEAVRDAEGADIALPRGMGVARVFGDARGLRVRAEADNDRGISVLKFILGLRIEQVAAEEKPDLVWTGHGADAAVLPSLREIRVARVVDVTPRMRRVTFTGRDMARYQGAEVHVRLLFPPAGLDRPQWPTPGRNGRPAWPPEEVRPAARLYTIRGFDAERGEIDIDFVMHGDHGIAGRWAALARAGDVIGILGPGGGEPDLARWYLFAGDETALPAIARHVGALPADAKGQVLIEVADAAEEQDFANPAGLPVTWIHRDGLEAGRSTLLLDAVRGVALPEDVSDCLFWLGAEAATARAVRTLWRDELSLPRQSVVAVAYWKHERTESDD